MYFLIGILILIIFIIYIYMYIKRKVTSILGCTIQEAVMRGQIQNIETPKSLSSMDSIYLSNIKKDFPDVNINEIKRMAEKELLNYHKSIEEKNIENIKSDKIKSIVKSKINDLGEYTVSYKDMQIHNTVISKYENNNGIATIYVGISYQYIYEQTNKEPKKVQDRVKVEFIYIIDESKVSIDKKVLGLNCPNCGSPITSLSKTCSYCQTKIVDLVKKCWTCNNIENY